MFNGRFEQLNEGGEQVGMQKRFGSGFQDFCAQASDMMLREPGVD